MKRRLTYAAVLFVLADLLVLGAAWHIAPALSLTAALAVPAVEPMLAPLYAEPRREDLGGSALRADVYRQERAYAGVVLVHQPAGADSDVERLARVLARRGVSVVVPKEPADVTRVAVDYAQMSGVPVRIADASAFRRDDDARTPATRAAYAWRLFRLVSGLLAPR